MKYVHETAWGTREFVIKDDQVNTLYFANLDRLLTTHGSRLHSAAAERGRWIDCSDYEPRKLCDV